MREFIQVERLSTHDVVVGDYGHNRKTCKRSILLHPRDEYSCANIVESNINIQEFSLQPIHQSL